MNPDDVGRLERGSQAAQVKALTSRRIAEQEASILRITLTSYRAGTLTDQQAGRAIAAISALRELTHDLDKEIGKASDSRDRLMSPGSRETATRS